MKRAIPSLICAVALLGAVPHTARAATQAVTMQSDSSIDSAIGAKFSSDDALKDYNLKASVKDGVATLTGTVRTTAQRGHAAELAKNAGARTVDNKIVVSSTATPKGTTGTVEKAWQKTKDGWEVVVDKTAAAAKAAGNEITDAFITTSIKTKFVGEDALKGSDISVSTDRHVVTLKGTVPTEAGRDHAVDIVKHTDGVNRIVDAMTIGPKK